MEICKLKESDEKLWDKYVINHPSSTFFHQIGWKNVVDRTYGYKSIYLLAKDNGEIKGIIPIFLIKSPIFGKKLISVPFAPYGGTIGSSSIIENSLIENAIEITKNNNADFLELRNIISRNSNYPVNNKYITFILKLNKNPDIVWEKFNNKIRNAIRKSSKSGFEIGNGRLEEFYKLYSTNMRDLGTPPHNKEFFGAIISEFKEKVEIITVKKKGEPISSAILLYFKDTVISGWAASDRKYMNLNSNNFLYWGVIRKACEEGYNFFDFGKSIQGSGTYKFKKPWGAAEMQLQYLYYLNGIERQPDNSQENIKRKLFARVWKRLPVYLTKVVGPKLRKEFP